MEIEEKIVIYDAIVPCWKFGMSLFTHDGQSSTSDKSVDKLPKLMVTHRIYINDRDISANTSVLNSTSSPLCVRKA